MQTLFRNLVETFARSSDLLCAFSEDGLTADIAVEGLHFALGLSIESGLLIVQTAVADAPAEGDPGRDLFLAAALRENNLFQGSRGFTLGLDEENLVTLQYARPIEGFTDEAFGALMANFASAAIEETGKLSRIRTESEAQGLASRSADDLPNLPGFAGIPV